MSIYTFVNLNTYELFTIEASTLQEAVTLAFKVCPFSKVLTRNSK